MSPALAASAVLHAGGLLAAIFLVGLFEKPLTMGGGVPITIVSQGPPQARQADQGDVEELSAGEEVLPEPMPEVEPLPPLPDPTPKPPKPTPKPVTGPGKKADLDLDRLMADVQSSRPATRRQAGGGGGTAKRDRTLAVGTSKGPSAGAKGYLLTLGTDLGRRWNPNCLVEGGADVNMKISFIVLPGGRLKALYDERGVDMLHRTQADKDADDARPMTMTLAASSRALQAVRGTEPFPNFPPELFGEKVTVNFNARQVCANR